MTTFGKYIKTLILTGQRQPLKLSTFLLSVPAIHLGKILPSKQNQRLHDRLEEKLIRQQLTFFPILAGDAHFAFTEPSFAIQHSFTEAISLAQELKQNAIFWVELGELNLVPVLLQGTNKQRIGRFATRLVSHQR